MQWCTDTDTDRGVFALAPCIGKFVPNTVILTCIYAEAAKRGGMCVMPGADCVMYCGSLEFIPFFVPSTFITIGAGCG